MLEEDIKSLDLEVARKLWPLTTQWEIADTHQTYSECINEINEYENIETKVATLMAESAERREDLFGMESLLTEEEISVQLQQTEAHNHKKQAKELVTCN